MRKRIYLTVDYDPNFIARLSYILSKSRINIDDINVVTLGDKIYVDLEVSDDKKTIKVLKANGFEPSLSDTIVVQLEDKPGELALISRILSKNSISIIRIDVIAKGSGRVLLSLQVDKPSKAKRLLKKYII
ncbi:hypothetical protein J7J26_02700 [Candidatus Micrarchaeota archaeon]|nr:hypothetical protein [Candidatus Micrarchaeota archaeon]